MAITKVQTSGIADDAVTQDKVANDAIGIAEIKGDSSYDGGIHTFDANGNPMILAAGTSGHFLKAQGAGQPPVFAAITQSGGDTSLELNDDAKVVLGTSDEAELYHNTSGATVFRNTADDKDIHLQVKQNSDIIFEANDTGNHKAAVFKWSDDATPVSSAELYYSNSKKLETTNTGVTVTGTLAATAVTGDGSGLTGISAGTALTGSTNNTVTTVTGANAIQGESKLTFDGNTLDIDNGGSPGALRIGGNVNSSGRTDDTYKLARVVTPHYHNSEEPMAIMQVASDGTNNNISYGGSWGDANAATQHRFYTAANDATTTGTEQWKIDTSGNLVAVQAGNGIDFSANANYTNKDDEILADYETGYFTPTTTNSITLTSTENRLWYVKVGHQVTISGSLQVDDGQSSAKLQLSGLPFSHGTIGGNGTQVSNSAFLAWGWDTQPTYSSDDKAFWVTITGTSMNLHVRTSNGDWHYFYPSDTTWLLFNFSYYTDS